MTLLVRIFCFLLFGFTLVQCGGDEPITTPEAPGYTFFPLKIGKTLEYKVDSLSYNDNGPAQEIDTFVYYYKEVVASTFIDGTGENVFLINRFYRNNDSAAWNRSRDYTAKINERYAIKTEENVSYVKLLFPLRNRLLWNGHLFTAKDAVNYRITEYLKNTTVLGKSVNTVKVQQYDIKNFVEEINRYERYGDGIGLVELSYDSLNTQESGTRGFRLKQVLIKAID